MLEEKLVRIAADLEASRDMEDAILGVEEINDINQKYQPDLFIALINRAIDRSNEARKLNFEWIVKLAIRNLFEPEALHSSLKTFMEDIYEDRSLDAPQLPDMMNELFCLIEEQDKEHKIATHSFLDGLREKLKA